MIGKPKGNAGFNLLEVMFAMAVMSIAVSGMICALTTSMKSQQWAEKTSAAQNLVREVMEELYAEEFEVLTNMASTPYFEKTDTSLSCKFSVLYPANGDVELAMVQVWVEDRKGSRLVELYRAASFVSNKRYED